LIPLANFDSSDVVIAVYRWWSPPRPHQNPAPSVFRTIMGRRRRPRLDLLFPDAIFQQPRRPGPKDGLWLQVVYEKTPDQRPGYPKIFDPNCRRRLSDLRQKP